MANRSIRRALHAAGLVIMLVSGAAVAYLVNTNGSERVINNWMLAFCAGALATGWGTAEALRR